MHLGPVAFFLKKTLSKVMLVSVHKSPYSSTRIILYNNNTIVRPFTDCRENSIRILSELTIYLSKIGKTKFHFRFQCSTLSHL